MTAAFESPESPRLSLSITPSGAQAIEFKAGGKAIWFLAIWLCGWVFGMYFAISQLAGGAAASEGGFLYVWLAIWTIGGLLAGATLVWGLFGSEVVLADSLSLQHAYKVWNFARTKQYQSNLVTNLRWIERPGRRNRQTGIEFDYGTRTVRIFGGVENAEAQKIIELLDSRLGTRSGEHR